MRSPRLLLVEDEDLLRRLVAQFLRGADFQVVEASDGPEGVDRFNEQGPFDLAVVDLNLPGYSGVEVCRRIRQQQPDQRILICSAAVTSEFERALQNLGIRQFLTKPYHPDALLSYVRCAVHDESGEAHGYQASA